MQLSHDNMFQAPRGGGLPPPPRRAARVVRAFLALSVVACCSLAACGQGIDGQREYNVKAVSLYAFGRYVTWPDAAFENEQTPFVIGVIGGNPFGAALDAIAAKKTLNGRKIVVRQITQPTDATTCHIVFVARTTPTDLEEQVFDQTADRPVLLVGETLGFAQRGGIINFYQSGANVRFELNPDRGAERQLRLDAKLLSLGTKTAQP